MVEWVDEYACGWTGVWTSMSVGWWLSGRMVEDCILKGDRNYYMQKHAMWRAKA